MLQNLRLRLLILGCAVALCSQLLPAQVLGQSQKLKVDAVTLYPGGVAYIQKRGRVNFERGKALLDENPDALANSLVVEIDGSAELKRKSVLRETLYRPKRAKSFFEILKANPGKQAIVTYFIGKEVEDVVGTIRPYNPGSDLIEIRRPDDNVVFVHKDQLKQVSVQGGKASQTYYEAVVDTALLLELATPFTAANVRMGYYSKGLSWRPEYRIREQTDSTVKLTMKAIVHNTGEALEDIELRLSLGIPAVSEGISAEERTMYQRLTTPRQPKAQIPDGQPGNIQEPQSPAEPKPVRGFTLSDVTIEAGSAAELTLLEQVLPTTSLQFVRLPLHINEQSLQPELPDGKLYTVQQARRITNTSEKPFLPGKVQLLNASGIPIGQAELPAMPLDAQAKIGAGVSEGVVVKVTERVGKEERKAEKLNGEDYDFLKIDGLLTIGNSTDEPQPVQIVVQVLGKPLRYLGGQKAHMDSKVGVNGLHTITYDLTLDPQRTYKYNYSYGYFRPTD